MRLPALAAAGLLLAALPAAAHLPFDVPSASDRLSGAAALPSAATSWSIHGLLGAPGAVQYLRLRMQPDTEWALDMRVPYRRGYEGFAPSMALLGPGLPPADGLPAALPEGMGALAAAYEGDPAAREVGASGTHAYWVGQSLEAWLPLEAETEYFLAVWDPRGGVGEYNVSYTVRPDDHEAAAEAFPRYANPLVGDANDDGALNAMDVVELLRAAIGQRAVTARLLRAADVYPEASDGYMAGDGRADIRDALRLLRRVAGLEGDPFP